MIRMTIRGIGVAGGFGTGVAQLREALEAGASRIGSVSVPTGAGTTELPAFRADTARLDDFIPRKNLRRIDHYSKMALLGACLALADAGMTDTDRGRMGVIVASGYGGTAATFAFLDSFINDGDLCASPTHFANSVHNAAAANIAMQLGITGPSLTVSQFDLSVQSALLTARQWLAEGRVDSVLVGGVDELSDLIGYTWYRRRGASAAPVMAPLHTARESAIPGEGVAFLLLSRTDSAASGYCTIDAVAAGVRTTHLSPVPADGLLLLGADGRSEFGERYRSELAPGAALACYTPLYGSMPASAAFDLAAAALCLRERRMFNYPAPPGCDLSGTVAAGELAATPISCLSLVGEHEFGLVTLRPLQ